MTRDKQTGMIISGGSFDREFCLRLFQLYTKENGGARIPVIAADRGAAYCHEAGLVPEIIVGDFDSLPMGMDAADTDAALLADPSRLFPDAKIYRYPPEKDWTDTELALRLARESGWTDIHILGATGSRLDHVLGAVWLLTGPAEAGISCDLVDPNNRITMHHKSFCLKKEAQWGRYVSLFAVGGPVEGLTLRGMKYPLENARLDWKLSLGVSNEIVDEQAEITFDSGWVLMIESKDS